MLYLGLVAERERGNPSPMSKRALRSVGVGDRLAWRRKSNTSITEPSTTRQRPIGDNAVGCTAASMIAGQSLRRE